MLCSLNEILEYKNPAVVARFAKEFPQKAQRAETIFSDLIRFFWGTKKHLQDRANNPENSQFDFVFIMDDEMKEIDHMWHIFLLYTRDYANFCEKYFGEFLHHQPDLVPYFEQRGFHYETNLERFLDYSYDIFGEDVLARWFCESLSCQKAIA